MAWDSIPSDEAISKAAAAVKERGINVIIVNSGKEARQKIISLIPEGSEVANGSSTTLNQIGFTDYLKAGKHGWKNLHEDILKEKGDAKQADLRRKMVTAEYFLGSINAIAETGELVACDASGSRVSAYPFAAEKLILVAGVQKITPTLNDAMKRVREYVFPLEDARAQNAYGMHSTLGKWVIVEKEINPKRITLILVKEKLGF